jgi:hypothetical protein
MRALIFALVAFAVGTRADVLNLVNGDRYVGSVQLVNEKEVEWKSETLGTIKIAREKVVSIFFGTNQPAAKAPEKANASVETAPQFDPKAIEKVQEDFLATATPEANAMFGDLVRGLSTGKLSIDDLRAQARDALKELRELQAQTGDDDSGDNPLLAGYVGILEKFINSGPAAKTAPKKTKPAKSDDE